MKFTLKRVCSLVMAAVLLICGISLISCGKKGQEPEREQNPLSGEDDQDSEDHIYGFRGGRSRNE